MIRLLAACLILLVLLLGGCQGLGGEPQIVGELPPQRVLTPAQSPDLALGAQVYAQNCTRCHGIGGQSDGEMVEAGRVPQMAAFTDPATINDATPAEFFITITEGNLDALMPPWGEELSEAERWSVALYVYTLSYSPEMLARGQQVWLDNCAECHGADGRGTADGDPLPDMSNLAEGMALSVVNTGRGDVMPAFGGELNTADQRAVVAYARSLSLTNANTPPVQVAQAATATPQPPTAVPANAETTPESTAAALEGTAEATSAAEATTTAEMTAAPETAATAESTAVTAETTAEAPAPATTEEANAGGIVFGQISNGTAGGAVPPNLPLSLYVVDVNHGETSYQTTADASGAYRFENVPMRTDRDYVVTTVYNGVSFVSDPLRPASGDAQLLLPITVYETGADASTISIDAMITQISVSDNQLQMVQIVSFTNTSDRVFINASQGGQTSVWLPVPAGAQYFDMMGTGYTMNPDGTLIYDNQPVIPGDSHLMHASFLMSYTSGMSIAQTMGFPINGTYEVLLATNGLNIGGSQLTQQTPRVVGGQSIPTFAALLNVPGGQPFSYTLSGTPSAQSSTQQAAGPNPLAYILIGAGIGAIGVAGVLFLQERLNRNRSQPQAAAASGGTPSQSSTLMKQIADLDIRFRDGKLDRKAYEKRRAELKAQLTALLKSQPPEE